MHTSTECSLAVLKMDEAEIILDAEKSGGAIEVYPDGGLEAWSQVFACFLLYFVSIGAVFSWGILQKSLYESNGLSSVSNLSLIGGLQSAVTAFFAVPMSRLVSSQGPRKIATIGAIIFGMSSILAGFLTTNFTGLIMIQGFTFGIGQGLIFHSSATLPTQYFKVNRNLATGIVYSGAGIGGAVWSLLTQALLDRISFKSTLQILGGIYLGIALPAALSLRSKLPRKPLFSKQPFVDWSLFRDIRFNLIFFAGAIALFPLFVAPFFLPLYASAIGLNESTASLILCGFNLASAVGRIAFGLGADKLLGAINAMFLTLFITGISTLIIWPLSHTVVSLTIFALVAGFFGGAFFSLMPGVTSSIFGSSKLNVVFGMIVTAWSPGYFAGASVAGVILQRSGVETEPTSFIPAIMYAGVTSLVAAFLILGLRLTQSRELLKKI